MGVNVAEWSLCFEIEEQEAQVMVQFFVIIPALQDGIHFLQFEVHFPAVVIRVIVRIFTIFKEAEIQRFLFVSPVFVIEEVEQVYRQCGKIKAVDACHPDGLV